MKISVEKQRCSTRTRVVDLRHQKLAKDLEYNQNRAYNLKQQKVLNIHSITSSLYVVLSFWFCLNYPTIKALDDGSRVSHDANVNKIFELVRNQGSSEAIRKLWRATFKGRRFDLESGKLNTTDEMLKTGCPVLNQSTYVSPLLKNI